MRFLDVLGRTVRSELGQMEAADLPGVSERTFRRWRDRHREEGGRDYWTATGRRRCGVREVVARHGLFCSLYTDRCSHYCETPEAGGPLSKTVLTQFGRALKQVGIEHIAAHSPQARGRFERMFDTLQDRPPKELALAGISTVEAANRWLADSYIAEHNERFAIKAKQQGSAFVVDATEAWREILCAQEDRTVGNDNTVKWRRPSLQLPPSRLRPRQRGRSVPRHAPAQSKNDADRSIS